MNLIFERKGRLLLLAESQCKGAAETNRATIKRLLPFKSIKSLALDNGAEDAKRGML